MTSNINEREENISKCRQILSALKLDAFDDASLRSLTQFLGSFQGHAGYLSAAGPGADHPDFLFPGSPDQKLGV